MMWMGIEPRLLAELLVGAARDWERQRRDGQGAAAAFRPRAAADPARAVTTAVPELPTAAASSGAAAAATGDDRHG
jgi:hypothetical protein